jgi:hypothetical protein
VVLFVAQLLEVTVIVTLLRVPAVAPVILKFTAEVELELRVWLKNTTPPALGLAVTLMVAPAAGRLVTLTESGKLVPGAGVSVVFTAGELVKPIPVSVQPPPPPPLLPPLPDLLQYGVIPKTRTTTIERSENFFITQELMISKLR